MLICSFQKGLKSYLPNQKEIEAFENTLEIYQNEDNLLETLEEYFNALNIYSPCYHFFFAIAQEERKEFLEGARSYIALADESNPNALACIEKAYALLQSSEEKDWQDNIRIKFEETLAIISQNSPQEKVPTCFICFNVEERDVGKWLEETFVPDLDLLGIKPTFCFRDLNPGQDLDNFQKLARGADQVIIACTPEFKTKYGKRQKAPVGLAQEVRMVCNRYNDPEKADTIFPIYLKGSRKESLADPYFEPIFGTKLDFFKNKSFEFSYFANAIELFSALRNVSRDTGREVRRFFLEKVKEVMRSPIDPEAIANWKAAKLSKKKALFDAIAHRVPSHTQMINLPLPARDFTGRELEKQPWPLSQGILMKKI